MKNKAWKSWRRPRFMNAELQEKATGVERPVLRQELDTLRRRLQGVMQLQEQLYYKELSGPQYLGPSKDLQILRLPGDMRTLNEIQRDLHYIQSQLQQEAAPQPDVKSEPGTMAERGLASPRENQRPGSISTKEIDDIMAMPKNELKAVGKRVDRPLVQLRDNSLKWPSRLHRAQPFKDVPLYSYIF